MTGPGVAVVGLGVGEAHARAYAAAGCDLRWLVDLDMARAEALAAELGAGVPTAAYEQVLGDPEVQVVSLASFDDAHYEQTLAALAAGKHVFVEKPLCRTLAELRSIKEAWLAAGTHFASNLVLRAAPLYAWLRDEVEAGSFGDLYSLDGDYLYGRLWKITDGWRNAVTDYSVVLGGGIHVADLMLWLAGERPVSVSAHGNRICSEGTQFRYFDFVAATFAFPSGLVGRITANFGSVHPHQHVLRAFGTEATFLADDSGARVYRVRDPGAPPQRLELAALPSSKAALIPAFLDRVQAGEPLPAAAQHDFDVISMCVAAGRAASEGGTIGIEYV